MDPGHVVRMHADSKFERVAEVSRGRAHQLDDAIGSSRELAFQQRLYTGADSLGQVSFGLPEPRRHVGQCPRGPLGLLDPRGLETFRAGRLSDALGVFAGAREKLRGLEASVAQLLFGRSQRVRGAAVDAAARIGSKRCRGACRHGPSLGSARWRIEPARPTIIALPSSPKPWPPATVSRVKVGILGCGYSGVRLAHRLLRDGHSVRGTVRSDERRSELERRGVDARVADLADAGSLQAFGRDLDAVVHLAPPPPAHEIEAEVHRLDEALPDSVGLLVYGSTTGVFGRLEGWIDERSIPGPRAPRGEARARYEAALTATGRPTRVVRIAGIYGPGRTTKQAIDRGLVLFEGGPPTSRIHVTDLTRILAAMLRSEAPDLVIACDEAPAPTLEVARFVMELLGEPMPPVLAREEAEATMSPAAREMRLGGRQCRSVERPALIGDLTYPTYRQGMKAALVEDGLLAPT